jgi:hypothetical protein
MKFVGDSFEYYSSVISNLSEAQLQQSRNSPDGHRLERDVLLAMYIHVTHRQILLIEINSSASPQLL